MGKIGDLWVRLGLKKQEFDNGIDQAERRVGGFGKAFTALKTVAVGAFAAIATAALAAFKNIVFESNKLGDQWRATVGGMQNAWNTFTNALLSWDWEGFWARLRGAYSSGKSLAGASDALTEQMNSLKMRRADLEQENARLRIEMQDQTKSYEERAEAAKKYLANVKPLYDEEADIRRRYLKEVEGSWLSAAGLDTNSVTFDALERFIKGGAKLTADMANDPNMVKIANMYQSMGDTINNQLADAYVNAKNAAGAFEAENRRIFSSLNMATAQIGGGGGSPQPQADNGLARVLAALADDFEDIADYDAAIEQMGNDTANAVAAQLGLTNAGFSSAERQMSDLLNLADTTVEGVEAMDDALQRGIERAQELKDEFIDAVVGGFSDGIQELTDQLVGLKDVNPGAILQALLTPLADMAVREGELLIAQGLGVEAVKESLTSLNGVAAITAGAALLAIGAATKSGLAALAKNGSGTTVANYSGTAGTATGETIRSELVVRVEGTLKGSDIVLSGQNTTNFWNR